MPRRCHDHPARLYPCNAHDATSGSRCDGARLWMLLHITKRAFSPVGDGIGDKRDKARAQDAEILGSCGGDGGESNSMCSVLVRPISSHRPELKPSPVLQSSCVVPFRLTGLGAALGAAAEHAHVVSSLPTQCSLVWSSHVTSRPSYELRSTNLTNLLWLTNCARAS